MLNKPLPKFCEKFKDIIIYSVSFKKIECLTILIHQIALAIKTTIYDILS